mmetsp:Transcript_40938/g.67162  ORF Transcript_40938/g.67162 Transcript_40938/m.67162 type:complete len:207 (+) Transcript_40938:1219-1839(+)
MDPSNIGRVWNGDTLSTCIIAIRSSSEVGIVRHQNNTDHSEHGDGDRCIFNHPQLLANRTQQSLKHHQIPMPCPHTPKPPAPRRSTIAQRRQIRSHRNPQRLREAIRTSYGNVPGDGMETLGAFHGFGAVVEDGREVGWDVTGGFDAGLLSTGCGLGAAFEMIADSANQSSHRIIQLLRHLQPPTLQSPQSSPRSRIFRRIPNHTH